MWLTRVLSSISFLFSIIVLIPLAFDVGGRACGLAFSLSLSSFYFFYSILRISTPKRSRIRWSLTKLLSAFQWILMPTLLIWSLNRFSVDAENSGGWVERTLSGMKPGGSTTPRHVLGPGGLLETGTLESWHKVLQWSTPFFQLVEGFCSLLVIQAAGQITRYLVNSRRSDTWMVSDSTVSHYAAY